MEAADTARELYDQRVKILESNPNNMFSMVDSPLVVLHLICDRPDGPKFSSTDQIPFPPLPDDRGAVGVNRTSYRDGMVVRENANGSSIRKYSYFD